MKIPQYAVDAVRTTRPQIGMDEIPFAPILSDARPPIEPPPAPLPVKRPVECKVVAWRHDGGLDSTRHETVELATAFATGLHWAVYWKYALQCGRDMIDRRLITAPPYANWLA
jgi:hypothetical protein